MFRHIPPTEYEIHMFKQPTNYKALDLKARREDIIKCALKGGAGIDNAIYAAERLIPEIQIAKAEGDYLKKLADWEIEGERIKLNSSKQKGRTNPWWPF